MGTTLRDIADNLNISVSTVSRALNNKGRMSPEMRKKILETAKKLHYQPNEIARELKMQRSFTIGVVVPDVSNEFYAKLLKSIDQELWDFGYSIIICDTDEKLEREKHYFELLKSKMVSGMIISPVGKSGIYDHSAQLENCVFLDNEPGIADKDYAFVGIDNQKAARELTNLLLDAGHRDIAIVIGDLMETTSLERLKAFEEALAVKKLTVPQERIHTGNCRFESGYQAMKSIARQPVKPTAILAHNNVEAYGVMVAAKELGIRIPDELSLVCFDDFTKGELMDPELTCVRQPVEEMGRVAVEHIINNLTLHRQNKFPKIYLDYQLKMGKSIKSIK